VALPWICHRVICRGCQFCQIPCSQSSLVCNQTTTTIIMEGVPFANYCKGATVSSKVMDSLKVRNSYRIVACREVRQVIVGHSFVCIRTLLVHFRSERDERIPCVHRRPRDANLALKGLLQVVECPKEIGACIANAPV